MNEIEQRGQKREEKRGVRGKQESNVQEDPTRVGHWDGDGKRWCGFDFLAWMEGGDEAEEKADGQDKHAEGDGLVSPIDEEER